MKTVSACKLKGAKTCQESDAFQSVLKAMVTGVGLLGEWEEGGRGDTY